MWLTVLIAAEALRLERLRDDAPLLSREERRKRERRITRRALQCPRLSPFATLFGSGCDRSLITLTGFDHRAFRYLLERYKPMYNAYTPYSPSGKITKVRQQALGGRPRSLDATQSLALVLAWTRTRGPEFVLCIMFGITSSVCSLFVRFGRTILLRILASDSNAIVRLPTPNDTRAFQAAISSQYSMLTDVCAVADGLKVDLEQTGDFITQNRFYNGWTHGHYVNNVFVFAPNGTVIACAINAPGSMHDSQVAEWGGIYEKLALLYERDGARFVVDSAFSRGNYPFLIKSSQDACPSVNSKDEFIHARQATSARQASEWGMRGLQGSFPRLKDRLRFEKAEERKVILYVIILLYNIRSRLVGINQILSTFMPNLRRDPRCVINM